MDSDLFDNLQLLPPLLRALSEEGYEQPTPVQKMAIPEILAGKDIQTTAQTGTGKTAAFVLPILQLLSRMESGPERPIRALILTPTRELALQIHESIRTYGRHLPLKSAVILGGVSSNLQIKALQRRPDILVATPGRFLDLYQQGQIRLQKTGILVLDEADRMLDMGFVHDVRRIAGLLPKQRQTMLFSATMSRAIMDLAMGILKNPVKIAVTPPASVAVNIEQKVFFVEQNQKRSLLALLLKDPAVERALVFTRTKHGADRIKWFLTQNKIQAEAIHSDKSQGARQRALADFDQGRVKVLIGTDIVSRGIDVDGISHVINFEIPNELENYVHRIGRTARAGAEGIAFTFCDAGDVNSLREIEKLTRSTLTAVADHPYHSEVIQGMRERTSSLPSAGTARAKGWKSFSPRRRSTKRSIGCR